MDGGSAQERSAPNAICSHEGTLVSAFVPDDDQQNRCLDCGSSISRNFLDVALKTAQRMRYEVCCSMTQSSEMTAMKLQKPVYSPGRVDRFPELASML